jgi:hypothetical protein
LLLHIYLAFALFKHCGWNVEGRLAEVGGPAGGLGGGPSAGDGGYTSPESDRGAEDAGHVQLHGKPSGLARCGRAPVAARSSCGSSSCRDSGEYIWLFIPLACAALL